LRSSPAHHSTNTTFFSTGPACGALFRLVFRVQSVSLDGFAAGFDDDARGRFLQKTGRITGRVGEERSSVLPTLLAVCGSVYDRWGPKELGKVNKSMTE
jgi:hypothetical protein